MDGRAGGLGADDGDGLLGGARLELAVRAEREEPLVVLKEHDALRRDVSGELVVPDDGRGKKKGGEKAEKEERRRKKTVPPGSNPAPQTPNA